MTPEQYQKCTAAFDDYKLSLRMGQQPVEWSLFKAGYEACIANGFPVPEGYFRVGEPIEWSWSPSGPWSRGVIGASMEGFSQPHIRRRRPAWEPKDGEAVFALDYKDRVHVATIKKIEPRGDGHDYGVLCQDGDYSLWKRNNLKPFDASKIGQPWSEL